MENNFYLDFENRFRGSRSSVLEKLACYDSLLQRISENSKEIRLLDIGCGRGEWLEKCSKYGFNCTGVEMNSAAAKVCQDIGLNIINKDVFEAFCSYPDSSFDVVSAFHFIEHIEHSKLIEFFEESKRLLSPSGVMILETPSIDNLIVSSRNFYLDPTHLTPINPDSITYIIESLGFNFSKYFYINSGPLSSADNHNLTKVLNGIAQDIVIVSTKTALATENLFSKIKQNNWERIFQESSSLLKAATLFDQENLKTLKRINNIDESIYSIRKEILLIKKYIQKISNVINGAKKFFIIKCLIKIVKFLFKLRNKISRISMRIIKLIFNRLKYPNLIYRLISNNYFTKVFVYLLKKTGFNNIIVEKLIAKQKVDIEYSNQSKLYNKRLHSRFDYSNNAKRLFDRIIK